MKLNCYFKHMSIKKTILTNLFFCCLSLQAQQITHVYKTAGLLKRISSPDTVYVVNFWATWCKPCIQELPSLDSLSQTTTQKNLKILLVCLNFKDEINNKVNPFLSKNKVGSEVVLLDEVNGNDYIDLISKNWTGAIPATLFKFGETSLLYEKKITLKDLKLALYNIQSK